MDGACRHLKRVQACIPVTVSTSYYALSRAYCVTAREVRPPTQAFKSGLQSTALSYIHIHTVTS